MKKKIEIDISMINDFDLQKLVGTNDSHLHMIEKLLECSITTRGGNIMILCKEKDVALGFVLFGSEKYAAPMSNYYRSFSVEVVIEKYKRYCDEYFHNWEQGVE